MKTKYLLEKKQYYIDMIKHAEDIIAEIDTALIDDNTDFLSFEGAIDRLQRCKSLSTKQPVAPIWEYAHREK